MEFSYTSETLKYLRHHLQAGIATGNITLKEFTGVMSTLENTLIMDRTNDESDNWLKVKDVQLRLSVSRQTVSRLIQANKLKVKKVRRSIRISEKSLNDYLRTS
ncbi:hypothetical protein LNTAR_25445 [Lentisphaera araneosa HTCC2155]|uniref:Helix-turn-helix domain-containing protein n=1 Tax=Lentisphaera araneosa HTCC2155 TaxID=313628 RepID=A6DSD1_9BACT|nr:helix-turn-helix domain-containing protein [Lentisphaera araneosa]EDM25476.1 hypothetical protein LNTAR_25445 [Lentisphaera araneosa HTCC2155]